MKDKEIFPHKYRVRRGMFGKSVLQRLIDSPSLIGGQVDSSIRMYVWKDVPFDHAPRALKSEIID